MINSFIHSFTHLFSHLSLIFSLKTNENKEISLLLIKNKIKLKNKKN
jgi:hypothetical protein